MTAGVVIPCMASTTVVYRHLKSPIGLSLSRYKSKLRGFMTSTRISYNTKGTVSTPGLQLENRDGYKVMNESQAVISQEWPNHNSYLRQSPPARVPSYAQIRKTTEMHVVEA